MTAIREITKVKPDGAVEVRNPALQPGEEVEVIVLAELEENIKDAHRPIVPEDELKGNA